MKITARRQNRWRTERTRGLQRERHSLALYVSPCDSVRERRDAEDEEEEEAAASFPSSEELAADSRAESSSTSEEPPTLTALAVPIRVWFVLRVFCRVEAASSQLEKRVKEEGATHLLLDLRRRVLVAVGSR
jgi:hypothetical protein